MESAQPSPAPTSTGVPWSALAAAEPAFAERVATRFRQYQHQVLATLRKDGSPRTSGLEVSFSQGELWLGMMPASLKAHDLHRDSRFALQANPGSGADLANGDVRVAGRAIEVTDPAVLDTFRTAEAPPPGPFHLFRTELSEVVWTALSGEEMVLTLWRPGAGLRVTRRR
ncbi:pyridoxamine 5'-phosphate oxidase family protein [Streptomyces sp. NPDC058373]|uniref:pyridoxamine 5'-phosphate oxidase family protein n=1 Tax=unclassified Streptomyces TaxID=2593676 RepID=UPI003664A258